MKQPESPETVSILLIDDDQLIRDSMKIYLSCSGIHLTLCQSLREGLDALSSNHYDLLLCDQCMLYENEESILGKILSDFPEMVKVVFTDPGKVDFIPDSQREAIDVLIPKPFSADCISKALELISKRAHENMAGRENLN